MEILLSLFIIQVIGYIRQAAADGINHNIDPDNWHEKQQVSFAQAVPQQRQQSIVAGKKRAAANN